MGFVELVKTLRDSHEIINTGGLALILAIVYAENGLFFGFFLPGDYLLFSTGLFCSSQIIDTPVYYVVILVTVAAILGTFTGYLFGKFIGRSIFTKKNTLFFKYEYLVKTRLYYMKFGGNTLIISKFLPVVRTFAPILAGVVSMDFKKFLYYTVLGCVLWVFSLVLAGYFLGVIFPGIVNYLEYIILAFLVVTSIVVIRGFFTVRKNVKQVDEKV